MEKEGLDKPLFHTLDITSETSVSAFSKWLSELGHPVSALVNNAGFAFKGSTFGADEAQTTIDVNLSGTKRVTDAVLPLLKSGSDARIVNLCSQAGQLKQLSGEL